MTAEPQRSWRRDSRHDVVPLSEATRVWARIALQTFGGPAGQIAVMQHTLVDQRRWIGQRRFLHALNYCMLLPGPEAQQLATYIGWLLNGTVGGLIAGTLFVLPGVIAMLGLSAVYVSAGSTAAVTGLFAGLAPAVIAIVVHAVHRVGKRALFHPALVAIAIASFLALTLFKVPFPGVVLAAGVVGWALSRWLPGLATPRGHGEASGPEPLISDAALHHEPPSRARSLRILAAGLAIWAAPLVLVAGLPAPVLLDQGLFFSGTAVVTFGGAYAVLSYVAQQAVNVYHWLAPGEMIRGLALAETTPGPLIMVVQFVAFVGAYRHPGSLSPWAAALIASFLVVWVTFVPCFLFIFLGAPYVERLRENRSLSAALTGITAAVVGVIANLATFFALHTLFAGSHRLDHGPLHVDLPDLSTWQPMSTALAMLALVLLYRFGWSTLRVLGLSAALGLVWTVAGLPG